MNAAARLAHQRILSRYWLLVYLLTRKQLMTLLLTLSVLLSALSIVYITYSTRMLHAHYQQQLLERSHLQLESAQLLLARSTWMVQAKIQAFAEKQLDMVIPDSQSVVILHE